MCTDAPGVQGTWVRGANGSLDEAPLDELVWVTAQDLTVLAHAQLALICIHDEVPWASHTCTSASASALHTVEETHCLSCTHPCLFMKLHLSLLGKPTLQQLCRPIVDCLDDPCVAFEDLFCAVLVPARLGPW